jgi:transcriptional regulator with XRE-family HTH domain
MDIHGAEVRRLRLAQALSQRELSELAKVSAETINEVELGKRPRVHPKTLRAIAAALDVDPSQLQLKDTTFGMHDLMTKVETLGRELSWTDWRFQTIQRTQDICIRVERGTADAPAGTPSGVESHTFCDPDFDAAAERVRDLVRSTSGS